MICITTSAYILDPFAADRPRGALGQAVVLLAALLIAAALSACGGADPAGPSDTRYGSNLRDAVAALGNGDGAKAERAAFALTVIDEARCEGYAALGSALAMQGKPKESEEQFGMAMSRAGRSGRTLVQMVAFASGVSPAAADPQAASGERWRLLLQDAMKALLAGDAVKAERVSYAVTQLEQGHAEVDALLGLALQRQGRNDEAKSAFDAARSSAAGPDIGLLELLVVVSKRPPVVRDDASASASSSAPPVAGLPAPSMDWCEVISQAPDAAVVSDAAARARMVASGLPWKVRHKKTGITMLLCPPGSYMMGSPDSEAGRADDEGRRPVNIVAAFYLSESEVTQAEWTKVMESNPSNFRGAGNPVEQVSWDACQRFCRSAGLRLPTESEWEYACRAGTTGAYAGKLASIGWYRDNSGRTTQPVRSRVANPWGFHDMHGNVWEWCEDGYDKIASSTQQASATNAARRVLRGGSWATSPAGCRSANRTNNSPDMALFDNGLRVARAAN